MHLFQVCDYRLVCEVLIVAQSVVCREALKTVYCPPNDIRNPGFSITNKAKGQAVKLSLQFRENNITMHMLFT